MDGSVRRHGNGLVFSLHSASRPHVDARRPRGRDAAFAVTKSFCFVLRLHRNGGARVSSSLAESLSATQNRCFYERHRGCHGVCVCTPAPPRLMTHSRTCAAAPCAASLCVREVLSSSTRGFASLIHIDSTNGQFGEFSAAGSVLRSRSPS